MSSNLNRAAAYLFAALASLAVVDVSRALADELPDSGDVVATTCGAGTLDKCADKPIEQCSWDFNLSLNPTDKSFGLHISMTDCKVTGTIPIYKNNSRDSSTLSGSCDLLAPFLGMPAGSGCS